MKNRRSKTTTDRQIVSETEPEPGAHARIININYFRYISVKLQKKKQNTEHIRLENRSFSKEGNKITSISQRMKEKCARLPCKILWPEKWRSRLYFSSHNFTHLNNIIIKSIAVLIHIKSALIFFNLIPLTRLLVFFFSYISSSIDQYANRSIIKNNNKYWNTSTNFWFRCKSHDWIQYINDENGLGYIRTLISILFHFYSNFICSYNGFNSTSCTVQMNSGNDNDNNSYTPKTNNKEREKKKSTKHIGFVAFAYERLYFCVHFRCVLFLFRARVIYSLKWCRCGCCYSYRSYFSLAVRPSLSIVRRHHYNICVCVRCAISFHLSPSVFFFGSRLAINVCSEFTNIPTTTTTTIIP